MVKDRPICLQNTEYRLPLLAKTDPPCSAVSAIAKLLVELSVVGWALESLVLASALALTC